VCLLVFGELTADGAGTQVFLKRLGCLFYDCLFAHLKNYSVSMGLGGTQLMLDLARYTDSIKRFRVPSLDVHFSQLRSIANLHLVEEHNIRPLLKELLITVPRNDLAQYLTTHEHYKSTWLQDYL
jgi:hypothetical protein